MNKNNQNKRYKKMGDDKPPYKKRFNPNAKRKFYPKKQNVVEEPKVSDGIRINKFISNSGICSRREADVLIKAGLVEINGKVITEMGYKIKPLDIVKYDGKVLKAEKKVYVLLNKPKGFITTTKDEKARKTVMDLVVNATPYRIYPVGRLDRPTTGVLFFTNDGDLAKKLTHPTHGVKKIYHVILNKSLRREDFDKILEGIQLEEGTAIVDKLSYINDRPKNELGIEIHIGWNRVIRRIFGELGYTVDKLDRVQFGGLTKKGLRRGHWKILSEQEIAFLKMI